jgi:hypothetical protein
MVCCAIPPRRWEKGKRKGMEQSPILSNLGIEE